MSREIGQDIKRNKKSAVKLAETVQGMMCQWTESEFPHFIETMELIRENAPVQYARLYMDAVKMGIIKEQNININISRQRDREDLQALVRTKITLPDNGTYTPYEEIKPKELAARRKEEEEY